MYILIHMSVHIHIYLLQPCATSGSAAILPVHIYLYIHIYVYVHNDTYVGLYSYIFTAALLDERRRCYIALPE